VLPQAVVAVNNWQLSEQEINNVRTWILLGIIVVISGVGVEADVVLWAGVCVAHGQNHVSNIFVAPSISNSK